MINPPLLTKEKLREIYEFHRDFTYKRAFNDIVDLMKYIEWLESELFRTQIALRHERQDSFYKKHGKEQEAAG